MKLSCRKKELEFLNYIKAGKVETAQNLAKYSYFWDRL